MRTILKIRVIPVQGALTGGGGDREANSLQKFSVFLDKKIKLLQPSLSLSKSYR